MDGQKERKKKQINGRDDMGGRIGGLVWQGAFTKTPACACIFYFHLTIRKSTFN